MDNDKRVPIALTIAGSDSSAGAGIQADIKSAAAMGSYMATVITALTAQNSVGVELIEPTSIEMVKAQLAAVTSDMRVGALKTGMIPNSKMVELIIDAISEYNIKNVVVDPVMVSTSGARLIDKKAVDKIIEELFPKTLVVTPNTIECSYITGVKINSYKDFDLAAKKFESLGSETLLLKGGHIDSNKLVDVLYNFKCSTNHIFEFERVDTINTHGTGCSLSAATAASLALGYDIVESIERAENFVHKAIAAGKDLVYGAGHGAISHFDWLKNI